MGHSTFRPSGSAAGCYHPLVQLRLPWSAPVKNAGVRSREREVEAGGRRFPIQIARHRWARRYILRVTAEGAVRLTVPRGASVANGLTFVQSQTAWITTEWARRVQRATWEDGTRIWHRGEQVPLRLEPGTITFASETIAISRRTRDPRVAVQAHLATLAAGELPARCRALGAEHGAIPVKVTVRNQRSRWGACAGSGTITLNWRLIQMPREVADYVMLHELAHLAHPNHSARFWRRVAEMCPGWKDAEKWLRRHGKELL